MNFTSFPEALSFLFWSTFVIAIVFGAVVNKTNFCTMGAVSDVVNIGDFGRFRAWLLAIAIGVLGVAILEYFSLVDINSSFPPYRDSTLLIAEHILGGIIFGIGMTLASGCGNKTLIRIGGGNIKSIFVFSTIALIAYYMTNPLPDSDKTLFSIFFYDWIRPLSISLDSHQDLGSIIAGGENTGIIRLALGLVIGLLLLIYIFRSAEFRANRDNILSGLIIGLVIVTAWYTSSNIQIEAEDDQYSLLTYYQEWDMLADNDEGKPHAERPLSSQSFTFINPVGQTYGYIKDGFDPSLLTFGLVAVFGVILGSFLWSLVSRSFRIEWFVDTKDFITHVIGAVLMGFGGVLALGCTIGQGITGFSTLALGSIVTFFSIFFGGAITMKIQYYKMVYEDEATFAKAFITGLVDMKLLPESMRKLEAI